MYSFRGRGRFRGARRGVTLPEREVKAQNVTCRVCHGVFESVFGAGVQGYGCAVELRMKDTSPDGKHEANPEKSPSVGDAAYSESEHKLADVLRVFSMDIVGLVSEYAEEDADTLFYVQGFYGSCFDSLGSEYHWYVSKRRRTAEMQPGGPYCDTCIKRWITEGRLCRTDTSPLCSRCKLPRQSYEDYGNVTPIFLDPQHAHTENPNYIKIQVPFYSGLDSIYGIAPEDLAVYREHAANNMACRLSSSLWLCANCWNKTPKTDVLGVQCTLCNRQFPCRNSHSKYTDGCCVVLCLDRGYSSYAGESFATRWNMDAHKTLRFSDELSMGEARRLCAEPACDDCVGRLIEQGKLVYIDN